MAFYTADWVRKLIAEEHKDILKHIESKNNDFRSYIDNTLPFTLYLDMDTIRKNVINENSKFIQDLGNLLKLSDNNILIKEIDNAYKQVINLYIDTFPAIDSNELESKLNSLNQAFSTGNIKQAIERLFKNTVVISNISKRNLSVLLIFPKFKTISSRFGNDFRKVFNTEAFSDLIDDDIGNSPRNVVTEYLKSNFGVLQNIGHVEVDIISTSSSEVKRGLVSPRLLQALVELPKSIPSERLVRRFSTETKQAETRIIVRKKFASKMVLEMLIESGMMIGSLESQKTNLQKAELEKKFDIGANLTKRLIQDKNLLLNLVTSKSITNHLTDNILSLVKSGKPSPVYTSTASISKKEKITLTKVKVVIPSKPGSTALAKIATRNSKKNVTSSLSALETLLKDRLYQQIVKNMGTGSSHNVLNFRTGRFAKSANVEKVTQSREGMVSVFYSYMRNPYGTFSEGGRQQYPRTRDPKTLISKSIREIGASIAYNRMRAVLV